MQKIKVYGVPEVVRELNLIDKKIVLQARSDMRVAIKPMKSSIESYIPNSPPLMGRSFERNGGMNHSGRTGWNRSAIKVRVKTSFNKRTELNSASLVSLVVGGKKGTYGAAGLQIADMAGKRGKIKTSGQTKKYPYKGGERSHALRGQGKGMIDKLSDYGSPSRFVWRAASMHLSTVQKSIMLSIDKLGKSVNKNLQVK